MAEQQAIDDVVTFSRKALWSLQASVTLAETVELYKTKGLRVVLPESARFGLSLDSFGISLTCHPGILAEVSFAPDVRIAQLRYTFANGAFHVEASGDRTNLFGLVGSITANKIEYRLHEQFGPLLPDAMRQPGYSPSLDPELRENLQKLLDVLTEATARTRREGNFHGVHPDEVSDLHLYLHAVSPENLSVPLEAVGLEIFCPLGTSLFVSSITRGRLEDPTIRSFKVASSPPGIVLRTPPGSTDGYVEVDIHKVHVLPGGHFKFDYDLEMDDIKALSEPMRTYLGLENVSFKLVDEAMLIRTVRTALDRVLKEDASQQLQRLLLKLDPLLPSIRLEGLLKLQNDETETEAGA